MSNIKAVHFFVTHVQDWKTLTKEIQSEIVRPLTHFERRWATEILNAVLAFDMEISRLMCLWFRDVVKLATDWHWGRGVCIVPVHFGPTSSSLHIRYQKVDLISSRTGKTVPSATRVVSYNRTRDFNPVIFFAKNHACLKGPPEYSCKSNARI